MLTKFAKFLQSEGAEAGDIIIFKKWNKSKYCNLVDEMLVTQRMIEGKVTPIQVRQIRGLKRKGEIYWESWRG